MADKYGGLVFPVPPVAEAGSFPKDSAVGDPLIGFVADYVRTILLTYVEAAWRSVSPGSPIVKTIILDSPEALFSEEWLPALFVYRPGRETRETMEEFSQDADDFRFQKGRLVVEWIMQTAPPEQRSRRDEIVDAMRKVVDKAIYQGRDPSWIVPGDDNEDLVEQYDPKAATFGSSLSKWAGFATLELQRAAPGIFVKKMAPPAKARNYEMLKMSIFVEELFQHDLTLIGEPHESLEARFQTPADEDNAESILETAIYEDSD